MRALPPSIAPYALWATEHITLLGVAGVCLLSGLFAWRNWMSARRRDRSSRAITVAVAALMAHAAAIAFVAPYRDLVVDVGLRLAGGSDIADLPGALLVGALVIASGIVLLILAAQRVSSSAS
jgi:hypothetical protein